MGPRADPVASLVVKKCDDMYTVLPGKGVDSQKLVHDERPKCQGERDENGKDSSKDHEQVPTKVDQRFPHQEGDATHKASPPEATGSWSANGI
jgi:hypothetical protein